MELLREKNKLVITDYDSKQLERLEDICSFNYRIDNNGRVEHEKLTPYTIEDGRFVTSMAFLHEIREKFSLDDSHIHLKPRNQIIIPFKKHLILWKEQQELLAEWYRLGRAIIESPTASGKTILGVYAIKMLSFPTLIVVPTDLVQKDVWYDQLRNFGVPSNMIGFFGGRIEGKTTREIKPITISTFKSAYLKLDDLLGKFEFLLIDECHHSVAKTYKNIALGMDCIYRMGTTATVSRQDMNHPLIFKTMGNLIQGPTMEYLEGQNKVAKIEKKTFFVRLTETEREEYEREKLLSQTVSHSANIVKEDGTVIPGRRSHAHKARSIAMGSISKLPIVHDLVMKHYRGKIIIFSLYLTHLDTLEKMLGRFRIAKLTHKTDGDDSRRILKQFKEGKIRILLTALKCDEGISVPSADVAIVVAGHGVRIQKIQRAGRIRRYCPFKVGKLYEIVTEDTDDERIYWRRRYA